jgi:ketosteroid isomerase-like protein
VSRIASIFDEADTMRAVHTMHAFAIALGIVCVLGSRAFAHEPDAEEIALGSLVDAELAFAAQSVADGVRVAFLDNFAADGVALSPAPVRIREAWREPPPNADPHAQRLEWKPAQAGVARSHDFGFTTGPYVLTSSARPGERRYGVFFSVWQRGRAGRWHVVLDAGTTNAAPVDFAALGQAPRPAKFAPHSGTRASALRARLLAREANGFGEGAWLTPNAYARLLRDDVRMHRNGSPPLVSRGAVAQALAASLRRVRFEPQGAYLARSADMAVTYGRYDMNDRDDVEHDGYYAHLWLRERDGAWRIAYDIALPARR